MDFYVSFKRSMLLVRLASFWNSPERQLVKVVVELLAPIISLDAAPGEEEKRCFLHLEIFLSEVIQMHVHLLFSSQHDYHFNSNLR